MKWLVMLLGLMSGASFVAAQEPKPLLQGQIRSINDWFAELQQAEKSLGMNDLTAKLKEKVFGPLGEKGLTGLDQTRPILGFANPRTDDELSGFVLVPVTNEADFLDLLQRLDIEAVSIQQNKGLYNLQTNWEPKVKLQLRFHDKYAYIGVNLKDDAEIATNKLKPSKSLLMPEEKGLLAVRLNLDQMPESYKSKAADLLKQLTDQIGALGPLGDAEAGAKALLKWVERLNKQLGSEGQSFTLRLLTNPKVGDVELEADLQAKPGTALAKLFQNRIPMTSQFAGLFGTDTVLAFNMRSPLFNDELKEFALASNAINEDRLNGFPEMYRPLMSEFGKGQARTIKTGEQDTAIAIVKRKGDHPYHALLAYSFEDTSKLNEELKKLKPDLPGDLGSKVTLDAAKVDKVVIHTMDLSSYLPPQVQEYLGPKLVLGVALTPKAIIASAGADPVEYLKEVVKVKPATGRAMHVQVHPKNAAEALKKFVPIGLVPQALLDAWGKDDKLRSGAWVDVEGGTSLKIRAGFNLGIFPRLATAIP